MKFEELAADAMKRYRALLVEVAEGADPDPTQALQIALAAGRSAMQLSADCKIAADRRAAVAAVDAADWDGKIATLQKAKVEADAEAAKAKAKFEAAKAVYDQAFEAADIASRRANGAKNECERVEKELANTLRKTGDANDWQVFRLDGEPAPVRRSILDEDVVINIGSGQRSMAYDGGIAL